MSMVQMIPVGSSARRAALLARIARPVSWLAHAWRQALSLR